MNEYIYRIETKYRNGYAVVIYHDGEKFADKHFDNRNSIDIKTCLEKAREYRDSKIKELKNLLDIDKKKKKTQIRAYKIMDRY